MKKDQGGGMAAMSKNGLNRVEYVWLDGSKPSQELRSKTRLLPQSNLGDISSFPEWGFDGSSTGQAEGHDSDCSLKPVFACPDPMRGEGDKIVLCEVFNADGTVHETNKRARLRELCEKMGPEADSYIGFEQEYTFFTKRGPLGWPSNGFPAPQGPFYCGIGADKVFGRALAEKHLEACIEAGLAIYGINAEVMPGQWEFQIGYRGLDSEKADPLTMSDHLWVGRYLLGRLGEESGVFVSFDNKPVKGDWNGAGMHTNFSTAATRDPSSGMTAIDKIVEELCKRHAVHINDYGHGLADRLTGLHETCSIDEFKSGVSNRGASIRIPMATSKKGYGYFEDRRPGANADPYVVSFRLLETVYELGQPSLNGVNLESKRAMGRAI